MHTEQINHDPAVTFAQTGFQLAGRPSLGAWVVLWPGHENQDLPAFVVMITGQRPVAGRAAVGHRVSCRAGIRASSCGRWATRCSMSRTRRASIESQRARFIDDLEKLNQLEFEATNNPEIATRIAQYEMAFRMQTSVPELTDLSKEPEHTFELYGPDSRKPGTFAANCLLARRLAERGVRFIQLYHRAWDHHARPAEEHPDGMPAGRSAERRADSGPEGARPAGRHAGHLGRRVRPDRLLPGQADGRRLRPRPSPALLHDLDGGRRHQARDHARRDRRLRLQHHEGSRCTFTT